MAANDRENLADNLKYLKFINDELEKKRGSLSDAASLQERINTESQIEANNKLMAVERERLITEARKDNNKLTEEEKKLIADIGKGEKNINSELDKQYKKRQLINSLTTNFANQLKQGIQYLMQSDKIMKQTILNLGMSGAKAELMRGSFEQSAGFVARLGGSLEDIQKVMEGYADETGRARALSAQMVEDITMIGKGTGLGIEQAAKLGAQFELMGVDAKATMDYVQGVVDTSERMGVNTTKVLKNINDNFKKLNTFTFQQGTKGFAQMAEYAEKMKIDMSQALDSASVAKGLEGAVDLAAQLQVMGGEFAKADPFQLLFLSRNDPAKFTEKINDMTKGVVSFRKMADGSFEKFISPADRDRLEAVGKALGKQTGEMTTQALRMADINKMRQEMAGTGMSAKDKELIEGMAFFDSKTNKFSVQIGNATKDISEITANDAKVLARQKVSLEERAKSAQTFEDAFKATIMELKSALLPILKSINQVLVAIRPTVISITEFFTKGHGAWLKVAGLFLTAGALFKTVGFFWHGMMEGITKKLSGMMPSFAKGASNVLGKTAESGSGLFEQRKGIGAGALAKGQGMKSLGQGAGIGAAAVGLGAGVGLAAVGISKLADSMAKLDKDQVKALQTIAMTLAITFPLAAVGILAAGGAATATAPGLLALGAAVLMVGGGVGVAAWGIGEMAGGLSKLVTSGKDAGPSMFKLAGGIAAISASMIGMTAGMGGVLTFSLLMNRIAKHAPALTEVGNAFKQINTVLSGSKDDFVAVQRAVEAISKANVTGGGALADLANMLKNPLKVEFADKRLALVNDITLNIDGQKFMQKVYNVKVAVQKSEDTRIGK